VITRSILTKAVACPPSVTAILAVEKVERIASGIGYQKRYVDVAIARWERIMKLEAIVVVFFGSGVSGHATPLSVAFGGALTRLRSLPSRR
jgi:hypothetical protein